MRKKPLVHIVPQGGGWADHARIFEVGVRVKRRNCRTAQSVTGGSPKGLLPC